MRQSLLRLIPTVVLACAAAFACASAVQPPAAPDPLSTLYRQVVKAVQPAVVEVRVTETVRVEQAFPDFDDFFSRFFGDRDIPRRPQGPREFMIRGLGSGVVVDAEKGYVLTNYHVVGGSEKTQVTLSDGRALKVRWARTDPTSDLAVLRVEAKDLVAAPLGDSDAMEAGDLVLAMGSPQGLSKSVTAGIISAKGRTTDEPRKLEDFLQTDAAINRGNSGGPLVNMKGEVIGINTAIISESGGSEGIGLAIPSNMAKSVMAQLIEKGAVTRGFLGVGIQDVGAALAKSFSLPDTKGALVSSVVPNGPAAKAGLREGDFIVSIGGKAVESANELRAVVAGFDPGRGVTVGYYREGKKRATAVVIGHQPAAMAEAGRAPVEAGRLGLEVETASESSAKPYGYKRAPQGALITGVDPGSPAQEQGLREGEVITEAAGHAVASAKDFERAVAGSGAQEGVRLRVVGPSGGARYVFLVPRS